MIRSLVGALLAFCLLLAAQASRAVFEEFSFEVPEQDARFKGLTSKLRCLVCQNQTLSDSNAPLAADLRKVVYEHIVAGESDKQIIDFLIERYGEFVIYEPPFTLGTLLLWLAPLLALAIGFGALAKMAKAGKGS